MWLLSQEQAKRLGALQRKCDLSRLGMVLGSAFPEAQGRLGERWDSFVEQISARAAACGLTHMLCMARMLACAVACGADFETRHAWVGTILGDPKRGQGAKAYQISMGVMEQLRSAPLAGQPGAPEFSLAMKLLDQQLADAGNLGSLLPRERIRLGEACDLDAIELQLVDPHWRQHYTAQSGPWRREACPPKETTVTLVHDPLADAPMRLPEQITLLSRPVQGDVAAKLRVRVKTEHRCDALLHPLVQCQGPHGARALRGQLAEDSTFFVHAPDEPEDPPTEMHIGEEDSPQLSVLSLSSCGLRARGLPVGELSTMLAAYDSAQHLIAWRREPSVGWELPAQAPPACVDVRSRREIDGRVVDSLSWVRGFQDLDQQLHRGMARLLTAWERESGVVEGRLAIDAALLAGSAGITWGWAERPEGIAAAPYMRLEGLSDLIACRLALRFTGILARGGSRSLLCLSTEGSVPLRGPWMRGPTDAALFAVAAKQQVAVHQRFQLSVEPQADAGLAVLGVAGPLRGAITGAVGLEQRSDGPGLRWFVRLNVEPVVAPLRIADPLLGIQNLLVPLLPAQALVDWSLA